MVLIWWRVIRLVQSPMSPWRLPAQAYPRFHAHFPLLSLPVRERLAKLAGGVAVIRVGGATEVEVKERKDRVDDAMHATRAAVEDGILPGGGVALLRSIKALSRLKAENDDQKTGIDIVRKTLSTPARQIAVNAGEDGSIVVGKISENKSYTYGYDAQEGQYGDLVAKGVIDPTKVVRHALQDAAWICRTTSSNHGGNGSRKAQEGDASHAWHAARWRHGLLKSRRPALGGPNDVSGLLLFRKCSRLDVPRHYR